MFIKPITCANCGQQGRPGETGFGATLDKGVVTIHCNCGNNFPITDYFDQLMLSSSDLVRLIASSNHMEYGKIEITPGKLATIKFDKPFDFTCKVFLTPILASVGDPAFMVRELEINRDGVTVLSSFFGEMPTEVKTAFVSWMAFGLVDTDNEDMWYIHFYGALSQCENGLFKSALIDYAVSFEVFIESYLAEQLARKYGAEISDYLIKRVGRIEDRCKELLKLATGHSLAERDDLYQPWRNHVKDPRDKLAHGTPLKITRDDAEKAHQAVYQVIRWIESLSANL